VSTTSTLDLYSEEGATVAVSGAASHDSVICLSGVVAYRFNPSGRYTCSVRQDDCLRLVMSVVSSVSGCFSVLVKLLINFYKFAAQRTPGVLSESRTHGSQHSFNLFTVFSDFGMVVAWSCRLVAGVFQSF